jgi:hypothetical protein
MNVEIGAEAAQFPEKEYISRIAVAVWAEEAGIEPRNVATISLSVRGSLAPLG